MTLLHCARQREMNLLRDYDHLTDGELHVYSSYSKRGNAQVGTNGRQETMTIMSGSGSVGRRVRWSLMQNYVDIVFNF